MDVRKEAGVENMGGLENGEMELINRLARRELKGSEVYVFQLRLCDNEIDREGERFSRETLEGLAPLFVGKSGIFDHNWSAGGQTARIYRTEVVEEPGKVTGAGDGACFLKGWAYMLRTPGNEELIAQIEGGIKREVSVGCAVERSVCSICGEEMGSCRHVKGRTYNGKLCWAELTGAKDAYEWSFVAVPAQRGAGVMKALSPALKELARGNGRAMEELLELEKEARMGRRYLDQLRREVVRLAAVSEPGLETRVVRAMVDKLGEEELEAMKRLLSHQGRERLEGGVQLTYPGTGTAERAGDGAFLV
ncbi:MAG: hypothetical protein HFF06_02695 [Oscillospiraceae bacterium]|nr:hypothetical protein [Oscillospiraceae bacterium]